MKRLLPVLVTAAVAVVASACGQQNDLAGKTPSQIVTTALSAATRFGGVHYNVQSTGGESLPNGEGDAGLTSGDEILSSGTDEVALLYVKPDVFVRGNAGGLQDLLALSATVAQKGAGKWLSIPTSDPLWDQIASVMTISGLLHEVQPSGTLEQSTPGKVAGHQVVGVRGKLPHGEAGTGTFWVATSPPNVLVSAESDGNSTSGSGGTTDEVLVFTKWGEKIRLTAPTPVVPYASIAG